jgi:hypothetical protein
MSPEAKSLPLRALVQRWCFGKSLTICQDCQQFVKCQPQYDSCAQHSDAMDVFDRVDQAQGEHITLNPVRDAGL